MFPKRIFGIQSYRLRIRFIWPANGTQTGFTTTGQSGPGSNSNRGVLHIPQISRSGAFWYSFSVILRTNLPVGWDCRIHQLLLNRWVRSPNECPDYDTKFDGEVPVMLELWGMQSTPSLPSLPGPLRSLIRCYHSGPMYGLNRTNCILILNWIVWNRTDYLYKNGFGVDNLHRLICHKTNQPTNQGKLFFWCVCVGWSYSLLKIHILNLADRVCFKTAVT